MYVIHQNLTNLCFKGYLSTQKAHTNPNKPHTILVNSINLHVAVQPHFGHFLAQTKAGITNS